MTDPLAYGEGFGGSHPTNNHHPERKTTMTSDQAMRALADEATQGQWDAYRPYEAYRIYELCSTTEQGLNETLAEVSGYNASADAEFIAACREWVPDALRRLDNARVIARKLLEASGAYSTLDATPEFPEAYQLAQDLYEALDKLEHTDSERRPPVTTPRSSRPTKYGQNQGSAARNEYT